jgi:hypothetical protein
MLNGLAAHTDQFDVGGHTPSDFPMADVNQDEMDEFEAMAEELVGRASES